MPPSQARIVSPGVRRAAADGSDPEVRGLPETDTPWAACSPDIWTRRSLWTCHPLPAAAGMPAQTETINPIVPRLGTGRCFQMPSAAPKTPPPSARLKMKKCLRRSKNREFPLPIPQTVLDAEIRYFTHSDTVFAPSTPSGPRLFAPVTPRFLHHTPPIFGFFGNERLKSGPPARRRRARRHPPARLRGRRGGAFGPYFLRGNRNQGGRRRPAPAGRWTEPDRLPRLRTDGCRRSMRHLDPDPVRRVELRLPFQPLRTRLLFLLCSICENERQTRELAHADPETDGTAGRRSGAEVRGRSPACPGGSAARRIVGVGPEGSPRRRRRHPDAQTKAFGDPPARAARRLPALRPDRGDPDRRRGPPLWRQRNLEGRRTAAPRRYLPAKDRQP